MVCRPNADIVGAHAREHILGEAHQHRERNALIEFQRENAVLTGLLRLIFQIFIDGHGSPPRPLLRKAKVPGSVIFTLCQKRYVAGG
jgi:hypothetical protein